jgi:serine/threonine protein kinase/Flp pilus assembly protein TadD
MIDRVIGHYKIVTKLGEGAMGAVYKAQDNRLKRMVALKFLATRAIRTDEDKARFVNEALAAAALSHPNICTVYDIDQDDGRTFIAMELVEGQGLDDRIASGPLEIDEAIDIAAQIAEGLNEAHEKGIIHRDIKPGNIMISENGRVKIMDFGVAKSVSTTTTTKPGATIGTVAYMSPEQSRGEVLDHRTDVWALGVVLYEMLTGRRPFTGSYEQAVIYAIQNEDPHSPMGVNPKVPLELGQVVLSTLVKDRNLRTQNAKKFLRALRSAAARTEHGGADGGDKTIAVLPFKNISPDEESDYFSDGLTEELMINLSRLKDMRVVSRTSSMRYKNTTKDIRSIGRELGARYIMEGGVRRHENNLRISAQLIDVRNDRQIWAETYKGALADVFDIQEKVSKQIVDALSVQLTPTERVVLSRRATLDPRAFDLCLRARDFLYQRTLGKLHIAIELFQKAIQIDPRYAAAYAGLGETYATLYQDFDRNETLLEKSIEACLKALMYDASLSEAYTALGLSYFHRKALVEALEASQKAIDLDPNSFVAYWVLGRIYHCTNRDREAIACYERAVALNPNFYTARKDMSMSYETLGDAEKYNETLQSLLEFYPAYLTEHPDDPRARLYFAVNLAEANRGEEAKREATKALELNPGDPLMLYNAACFYSRLGDKAVAVKSLKEAVDSGFGYYDWIKTDPDLESIRNEPGYLELIEGK